MTDCTICRHHKAEPGFDVCSRCLQIGLDFITENVAPHPHWPVTEYSELFALKGRRVEVVAHL